MFEKLSKAQPIGRMAQPSEIAYAALFLSSDEAAFITGTALPVDGGTSDDSLAATARGSNETNREVIDLIDSAVIPRGPAGRPVLLL